MTTNIPYVAWAGTQVRMVKCSPALEGLPRKGLTALVESWSGSPNLRPQIIDSSLDFVRHGGERCARFNVVTLGDGLARIKLKAFDDARDEILEHQFLGIWLRLGTPAIDEVGATDPTGGPVGSDAEVGDPAGDGSFLPSSNNGRVQVKVTGTFPDESGATRTLPTDWAALASELASDVDPTDTNPAMRWDIHDDSLKTEGHVAGFCAPPVPTAIDAVDNCRGGDARFSRVFGDFGRDGGPFDPVRLPSLLSDGKLDAGDAPMPAARVDIKIAPNTNPLTDIGGAGALVKADKTEVYSRDGNGTDSAHNLYAPYYWQYVPATAAGDDASGTDWFVQNNFGLNYFGVYDNWDTLPLKTVLGTATGCNRTVDFEGGREDHPRSTPSGDQTVAVFTDEHGEAQVEYVPFAGGFYYDAVGGIVNDNRGCDLQDVDVLGTSAISATAKYPGQPPAFPAMTSATINKTVGNEFDKSLRYYPKGEGAANANANIVVAHGQDVDGTPFAGERVCFYVDDKADSYRLFSGVTGPADARFRVTSAQAPTPSTINPDVRCAYLDANGNAALEVFNSGDQTINVISEYIDEGLLRDIDAIFGAGDGPGDAPSTEPPPNTGGGDEPSSGPGTNPPTAGQVVKTVGSGSHLVNGTKTSHKTVKTRITKARLMRVGAKRYLVVKVKSSHKRVKLAIRLRLANGKVLKTTRKVRANKTVRVMRVSWAVKSVKVKLAK